MKYDDFTSLLSQTTLSGREFAKLLKLNPNTIANYKRRGTVPAHLAVIALLILSLEASSIPYKEKIEGLELEPKAARGRAIRGAICD
jgi:hypothetical protein